MDMRSRPPPKLPERRFGSNRRKTKVETVIHYDGGSTPARILDISHFGMKIISNVGFESGTAVFVELQGHRIPAIVHWCRFNHAGLRLAERLDRETLHALETADDELQDYR